MTGSLAQNRAFMTVDFEDYRRQELRDVTRTETSAHPQEVRAQLELLLDALEACNARATFFSVGRLVEELPSSVWQRITKRHRLGCHGHEHLRVVELGPSRFREDTSKAKQALEQAAGVEVLSYRAPYFSSDGCDPWFGTVLAELGFQLDSSRRLGSAPAGFSGTLPMPGAEHDVVCVPLPSIGVGPKRITVIGGTYLRLAPLPIVDFLVERAKRQNFIPMVYLHPYDLDPSAAALDLPTGKYKARLGDWVRRRGRASLKHKLRHLAERYTFEPIESVLCGPARGT